MTTLDANHDRQMIRFRKVESIENPGCLQLRIRQPLEGADGSQSCVATEHLTLYQGAACLCLDQLRYTRSSSRGRFAEGYSCKAGSHRSGSSKRRRRGDWKGAARCSYQRKKTLDCRRGTPTVRRNAWNRFGGVLYIPTAASCGRRSSQWKESLMKELDPRMLD